MIYERIPCQTHHTRVILQPTDEDPSPQLLLLHERAPLQYCLRRVQFHSHESQIVDLIGFARLLATENSFERYGDHPDTVFYAIEDFFNTPVLRSGTSNS
jgi:hypothetical protein